MGRRGKVPGATDPSAAAAGSLRRKIDEGWARLGLPGQPSTGGNRVHASASPFEGPCERMNWLGTAVGDDAFGRALLGAGVPVATAEAWRADPMVAHDGAQRSLFDLLEDHDAAACLVKARAVVAGGAAAAKL